MIRSFQARLVLFFSALFVGVQLLTLAAVYWVSRANVIDQLGQGLAHDERIFQRLLTERGQRIADATRILVADFGFRAAAGTGDAETLGSALENLGYRIHGQRGWYIDLDGRIVADTAGLRQGGAFLWPDLLAESEAQGQAVGFGLLDEAWYELAVVPVQAPLTIGWVAIALAVDRGFVEHQRSLSPPGLELTLLEPARPHGWILASSLPPLARARLAQSFDGPNDAGWTRPRLLELGGESFLTLVRPLPGTPRDQPILAVLQTRLAEALRPYAVLWYAMLGLLVFGLAATLLGGYFLAGRIARPVRVLAHATREWMDGQIGAPLPVTRDDELGRLTETFNHAIRIAAEIGELKEKDRLRRELVANVSHDLRSPLTSLHGYLETLRHQADSLPREERERFLGVAVRQSEKLGRLAQELFELARLECGEGEFRPEAFCLRELLYDVAQKYELQTREAGVTLVVEAVPELPWVLGDIGLIERVLANLVDNALRHATAVGEVRLEAESLGSRVEIRVRDDGGGIAPEFLPRLFEWDSPLSRGVRRDSGGLGLILAGRIARLHGGAIRVESELGRGSVFRFDLPVKS